MTRLQSSEWYSDKQSFQFKFKRTALQVSVQHLCEKLVVAVACTSESSFFLSFCLDIVENKQCNTAQEIKGKCRLPYHSLKNLRGVE